MYFSSMQFVFSIFILMKTQVTWLIKRKGEALLLECQMSTPQLIQKINVIFNVKTSF